MVSYATTKSRKIFQLQYVVCLPFAVVYAQPTIKAKITEPLIQITKPTKIIMLNKN